MSKPNKTHMLMGPFQRFFQEETSGGIVLFAAAIAALFFANSPWQETYTAFWQTRLTVGIEKFALSVSLRDWINDGLMAVFFLLVGLEIKRQFLVGELSQSKKVVLPMMAAAGGMLLPGLFYMVFNPPGTPFNVGWGIPTVTDIAFSLGALALLGNRVPLFLKIFLTALAIVGDLGAVLLIALFYSAGIQWTILALVLLIWGSLFFLNHLGLRGVPIYILGGILLWCAMFFSGIHASISGALLAFAIPLNANREASEAPLQRLEQVLHPWVTYGIVPLFALANAGVSLSFTNLSQSILHPITQGIVVGLLLGKPLGILGFSWLSVRLKLAELPKEIGWHHLLGLACLGGIGFTMSLFIADLAFQQTTLEIAKIGILIASVCAGLLGLCVLWKTLPRKII